ncbi:MAG TPA: glycoside hydrolase family 30 beta sandwich domain-containing protein [Trebonia sp.]|jgi:glucosylceramidase|nr:glycoside hydrolase family 30 beta sandwich domain-containing protein [Trebonia sp.]
MRVSRKIRKVAASASASAALAVAVAVTVATAAAGIPARAGTDPAGAIAATTASVTVVPWQAHQVVDGFGFAEAFREPVLTALPAAEQERLGALLFSARRGAGMSIVRFGLGGATDPGDPISGPGDVADQAWLGKLAERFGVRQFYADAWSAPPPFKTNDSLDNGGYLCGVPGESCASGDSRQAYASYLAAEAQGFARQGIPLEAVDFVNEPEIGPAYASMYMTPAQAADFVPYLGRALADRRLPTKVACCDAEGWLDAPGFAGGQAYTKAVLSDPRAARYISLITSHGYTAAPSVPLTDKRPVWETEWADFGPWDASWDDGTAGDGFTWAQKIQDALTQGDVDAFCYWWGASASTANSGLIQVQGSAINLSKRYWAFAAFGRYIRPGAVRIGATTDNSNMRVSAFRDRDGATVVEILNSAGAAQPVALRGVPAGRAAAYVTNEADALAPRYGPLTVPARSLLTVVVPAR